MIYGLSFGYAPSRYYRPKDTSLCHKPCNKDAVLMAAHDPDETRLNP